LKRAAYLCERRGTTVGAERNTTMPREFLMQQMEWREALDEAADGAAVQALQAQVAAREQALLGRLQVLLDQDRDAPAAAEQLRSLMFVARFRQDVEQRLDALES
jgi:molecular chaperone HscB